MPDLATPAGWLPVVFVALMGLAMFAYVVLDGYDLGVGILLRQADDEQKDVMIASIGPFWDANETWLVLGIGLLLVAFPVAHGAILTALYLPVSVMLVGLILRGVAFDFRVKAQAQHKPMWNNVFWAGSMISALSQGYMLGSYVTGFSRDWPAIGFAVLIALCTVAGYAFLGASWLVMKTEGPLQQKSVGWARLAWWGAGLGILGVSVVSPWVSERIFEKWFTLPYAVLLLPIPVTTAVLMLVAARSLKRLPVRLALDVGNTHPPARLSERLRQRTHLGRIAGAAIGGRPNGRPQCPSGRTHHACSLLVDDLGNLVGASARRRRDFRLIAFFLADHGTGERRGHRNLAFFDVRLVFTDNLVGELLFRIDVDNRDRRAETDFLAAQLADVDDVGARQLVVEFADASLDEALLLLGGVILGVFRKIAVRPRLGNGRNDIGPLHGFQHLEFSLKGGMAFGSHRNAFHREFPSSCAA
jgi:cytochrome d ubiquinol oxidase subunit II